MKVRALNIKIVNKKENDWICKQIFVFVHFVIFCKNQQK